MLNSVALIASAVSLFEVCRWALVFFAILGGVGIVLRNKGLFCTSVFLFGLAHSIGLTEIRWEQEAKQFKPVRELLPSAPGDKFQLALDRPAPKSSSEFPASMLEVGSEGLVLALLWLAASLGIHGAWLLIEAALLKSKPIEGRLTLSAGYSSLSYCAGTFAILGGMLFLRVLVTTNPDLTVISVPIVSFFLCILCSKWSRDEDERYLSLLSPVDRSAVLAEREREARERARGNSGDSGGGSRKSSSSGPPPLRDRSNDQRSATH